MTISSLWRRLKHRFSIDEKAEAEAVTSAIGDLSIKVSSPDIEIRALSGGNQQKSGDWSNLVNQSESVVIG